MTKLHYILQLLSKPSSNTLNYRLSRCAVSDNRCFSSKSKDTGGDSSLTTEDSGTNLKKSTKAGAKSESSSNEEVKENAKKKLFNLLSELQVDHPSSTKSQSNLNLAKAVKRPLKSERFKDILEKQNRTPQDEIASAAKAVAESVPGDPKDTLAKLNEKLRILNLAKQPQEEARIEENIKTNKDVGESLLEQDGTRNIMSSVKEVAAEVTDGPIDKSSLSQRLLRLSVEGKSTETPRLSLDTLVKSMKMDTRSVKKPKEKFEQDPIPVSQRKHAPRSFEQTKFNLFDAPPLELNVPADSKIAIKDSVWWQLEEKQMKLSVQFAPCNAFEEMIMWTEQGKHWKLPVDNETEMGAEENVGFHEHVFLEEHLHGFPTKGPIRHFMELVVVGLSMNPYISVERKIENINWFRDYFKEKEEILQECGALG